MKHLALLAGFWAVLILGMNQAAAADPAPLIRAHAHNDYEHARPLLDALEHGFCSVEADIHLVDGELLVAHDRDQVKPGRTLQALYLDPLRRRAERYGGRIYPGGPGILLLVDIKSEAEPTYRVLREVLEAYREILTTFTAHATTTGAVTVIISGNRPIRMMEEEHARYAAIDGRLTDLSANPSPHLFPLISDNWQRHFQWRETGPLSEADRKRLEDIVAQTHAQKRKLRFWAVPDRREAWKALREAGVDLINTDNLSGLRDYLTER